MTIMEELNRILYLLEAQIPAHSTNPENEKLRKRYVKILADYFQQLEQAFPYDKIDQIYYKNVTESLKESVPGDTEDIFGPILRVFRARLITDLVGLHVRIYLTGDAQMITWGRTKGGIPIAYEGPPIQQAIKYAEQHCAKLVTQMGEESKNLIAQVISDAIENKRGIPGLARDIRSQFEDMSKTRAEMIARTESADALEQAFMDRSKAMGITGKEVVTGDPCEICQVFEDEGIVPIDHEYIYGAENYGTRPPFHPNCVCALAPAMLKEE